MPLRDTTLIAATWLLIASSAVAGVDVVWLHLVRCQLYRRAETRREHLLHTWHVAMATLSVGLLFGANLGGVWLWAAVASSLGWYAVEMADLACEKQSRASLGGLSSLEYALHINASGLRFAFMALLLASKPAAAWSLSSPARLSPDYPLWMRATGLAIAAGGGLAVLAHLWLLLPRYRARDAEAAPASREEDLERAYDVWLRRPHVRALAGYRGIALMNTPLLLRWQQLELRPTDRVLDVGCGTAAVLGFLAARVEPTTTWYGVDVSRKFLALARQLLARRRLGGRVVVVRGVADRLPFADASFDVVLSSHVLHHVPSEDLPRLFRETRRVLKPGGRSLWWAFAGDPDTARGGLLRRLRFTRAPEGIMRNLFPHSEAEIAEQLRRAGLVPQELRLGRFLLPPVPRMSIAAVRPIDGVEGR